MPDLSPKVSICIPTYNGKGHLKECIDSIRAQTFHDFEVVICDDQSADGTLDYARDLAFGDSRFRFIHNFHRFGLVGNWNNCIEQARGEWIKFVFQDDIIAPTCVEKLLNACEITGKPFSFCMRDFIFEDGMADSFRKSFVLHKQRLQSDYQYGSIIDAESAARIAIQEPAHNLVGEPTVTLINRSIFQKLGNFEEALIQLCDAEFWIRLMINEGAAIVPETLAVFRIHAKAATAMNHWTRTYRMSILDSLVLRYRFAFDRRFKLVRNPQLTGKSILWLRVSCASDAARAWMQTKFKMGSEDISTFSALKEWKSVTSHCKGLQALAHCGRVINLFHRASS